MITAILAVLALFVLQTLLPASIRYLFAGPGVQARLGLALGSRDTQPPMPRAGERAARALTNLFEALPVFLTLALLLAMRGSDSGLAVRGAWVFFVARLLYVPAYLSGVYLLRSIIWVIGWVGLGMMITELLR